MSPSVFAERIQEAAEAADNFEYAQAIELYTAVLGETNPQAPHPAEKEARLTALRERGRLLNLVGEQMAALAGYEQYYLEAGNSRHAVEALVLIGNQSAYIGHYQKALDTHTEALQLAEALNYTAGRAQAMGGQGLVLSYMGRSEEALTTLSKSLALFEQLGDKVEQVRSLNRVGVAHMSLGEIDRAVDAFERCSQVAPDAGLHDPTVWTATVNALNNLGECYQRLFDMEQALAYHQQALTMVQERDVTPLLADLYRNLGVDLHHLGRSEEGLVHLRRALDLSERAQRSDIMLQSLYSLAYTEIEGGDAEAGLVHADRLHDLAAQGNLKGYLADALHVQGLYARRKGDRATAEQMWQQALFLAHEAGRRILLWQLHAGLAQISTNAALKDVHNRIAAEVIQQIAFPIQDETLRQGFLDAPAVRAILQAAGQ
jgi:tetratricopeptide (TPR) repeat protein